MTIDFHQAAHHDSDPRVDLAVQRTQLACDRTLLAWIRTSFALITAGVAFDKGAQWLHEARIAAGTEWVRTGHLVGLTMTGVSVLLLVLVTWDYLLAIRALARVSHSKPPRVTPALVASAVVIVLGCAGFVLLMVSP